MTIVNNPVITKSLGELNKNINRMGKVLASAASGMKINGASEMPQVIPFRKKCKYSYGP